MTLQWIMKQGFPENPADNDRMKNANGYVYSQIKSAISYMLPYHTNWNVMSDLLNSQVNKRLKLPKQYALVVSNDIYKNYEVLSSQMNLDEMPVDMKPLYGQNKDLIAVYEEMLKSEDERIDGPDIRRTIFKQSIKNQIAWLYMYADDKKITSAYNKTWRNEISVQAIDASKIHYDPSATKQDLSDCEYIVLEENTNINKLIAEFGKKRIKELGITGGSNSIDTLERNLDDSIEYTDENAMTKFIYFFREANANGSFNYYSVPMVESKMLEEPKKLKPNRYPFVAYTRIKIFDDQLMGTSELYQIKDDYVTKVKVNSSLATNAIYESGQQKLVNNQNVSGKDVSNLMFNPFAIISVKNTSDVRNQVVALEKREAPQSAYVVPAKIDEGMKETVGVSDASQGDVGSLQSGQGATAAISAANLRLVAKTSSLKIFFKEYAIMLKDFMSSYYNVPMVHVAPKKTSASQFKNIFAQQQSQPQEGQEESKETSNLKAELKKYKIKFKEDDDNIYIIATMSDLKNMKHKVSINSDKFAKMDEASTSRALETLYAMDTQDPTGTRILTKEKFVELNPAFKGIKDEILNAYNFRKSQTEKNKVKFITNYTAQVTKTMAAQAQQQGVDSSNINTEQIVLQAVQVWQQLPENMKSDGSMAAEGAESVANNKVSGKGKDNKVAQ